jgi:hypothetical protein
MPSEQAELLVPATAPDAPSLKTSPCALTFVLFVCGLWIILGLSTPWWYESDVYLVAAGKCRLVSLAPGATNAQYDQDMVYRATKERRAADSVELCERSLAGADANLCAMLDSILVDQDKPCPFGIGSRICHSSEPTITMTTPWTSSHRLGLNIESAPVFRRTASCAVLNTTHPNLIKEPLDDLRLTWLHSYYYGSVDGLYATFQTVSTSYAFKDRYPTFAVEVISDTVVHPLDKNWTAYPIFKYPSTSTLTLIFAGYQESLLPVNDPGYDEIVDRSLPIPIACVETQEYCDAAGHLCWKTTSSEAEPNSWHFLIQVLLQNTTLANSIGASGGQAVTLESPNESGRSHWDVALTRQFKTSLAMLFNKMREFTEGAEEKGDQYIEDCHLQPFCGKYTTTASSADLWGGVVAGLLWALVVPTIMFLLTRRCGEYDGYLAHWFDGRHLVIYGLPRASGRKLGLWFTNYLGTRNGRIRLGSSEVSTRSENHGDA